MYNECKVDLDHQNKNRVKSHVHEEEDQLKPIKNIFKMSRIEVNVNKKKNK